MRKITTSLAIVGFAYIQSASAGIIHSNFEGTNLQAGLHEDLPILKSHHTKALLENLKPEDTLNKDYCGELNAQHRVTEDQQLQHKGACDCRPNKWGCDSFQQHKPHSRHIEETKQSVTATVIPVQEFVTEVTQNTTSDICSASAAYRKRHD